MRIDGILDRGALPAANVISLVATGDEEHFGLADDFGDCRIFGGGAIGQNERGDRIQLAELIDVGVVVVVAAGAQDHEVAAIAFFAKPAEGIVEIRAAAHHRDTSRGIGLNVLFITETEILPGSGVRHGRD